MPVVASAHRSAGPVPRWSATVASTDRFGLGEGPVWDPVRRRVLWVDINAGRVHEGRLDSDQVVGTTAHALDRTVGAVACSDAGDLLVAGAHDLLVLTAAGDRLAGPAILPAGSRRRLNDGKCDPAGRFLIGSLNLGDDSDDGDGSELLVRVERQGGVTVVDDDLTLSNGLGWSADGTLLYSIDSVPGVVWVRGYDPATGTVGPRREWLRLPDDTPDGMCVDAEDHLWIAIYGGGQIRRYTPDGRLVGIVEVPAPRTTCAAFVGPNRDRLLITTATDGASPDELAQYPDAGRLFLARVGVAGQPVASWAGPTWPNSSPADRTAVSG